MKTTDLQAVQTGRKKPSDAVQPERWQKIPQPKAPQQHPMDGSKETDSTQSEEFQAFEALAHNYQLDMMLVEQMFIDELDADDIEGDHLN